MDTSCYSDSDEDVQVLPSEQIPAMNSSFVSVSNFDKGQEEAKMVKIFQDNTQDKVDIYMEEYLTSESYDEVVKFIRDSENQEVTDQIHLRVAQSIINRWDGIKGQRSRRNLAEMTHDVMVEFEKMSKIDEADYVNRLLQMTAPYWKDLSGRISESNGTQHRNVCLVLNVALDKYGQFFAERERLLMYLAKVVEECPSMEGVLFACHCVELLTWKQQISKELVVRLRKVLQKFADTINQCPVSILSSGNFDRTKYQVGHVAKWLLDNLLVDQKATTEEEASAVKLSSDRFSVRCDQYAEYPVVCASFPVMSGTFYYEATVLTSGPMTIGWATSEADFNKGVGFDRFSIGIDGFNQVLFHGGAKSKVDRAWKEGDILGCLIDVPKKKFVFSLNGKKLESRALNEAHFSNQSYYAVVQLSPHQQCYFNFGQAGFKHPSKGVTYSDFHTASGELAHKYHLLVPSQTEDGSYWFKKDQTDNQVEPFFRDEKQDEFDRWVIKLMCKITDFTDQEESMQALEDEFKDLMDGQPQTLLRLIQSIIEELGSVVKDGKIDTVVELIEGYLGQLDPEHKSVNLAKLLELTYPYMQLQSKCLCDRNNRRHRNLCLVLSLMRKLDRDDAQQFLANQEVINFLKKIITESEYEPSQLLAINCLDQVNADKVNLVKLFGAKLEEMSRFLQKCTLDTLYTPTFDYYRYQIAFCARWLLDRWDGASPARGVKGAEKAQLDLIDMTPNTKLSANRLCARADADWQSVSSVFPITSGVYFYEVILLTSGSMRIGWATKECEFEEGKSVGNDEYSIGYDGHQKKICHIYGDYTLLKKNVRQWKAGDVVGCLIDVSEKRFAFYLNGVQIEYQTEVFFSPQPYFAAVSLSAHQQAYFNFGQAPFQFPPSDVAEFRDFYNATATNLCPFCSKEKAEYRFANCDHWTVCLQCLGSLKKCPTCNPTSE